jgi:hypothetical protein
LQRPEIPESGERKETSPQFTFHKSAHLEQEVDEKGRPYDCDFEDGLRPGGAAGRRGRVGAQKKEQLSAASYTTTRATALSEESLLKHSFLFFRPTSDAEEFVLIGAKIAENPAPDNPLTWKGEGGTRKWHVRVRWACFSGWGDFSKPVHWYPIRAQLAALFAEGNEPADAWQGDVSRWKGRNTRWTQYLNWDDWGPRCLMGAISLKIGNRVKKADVTAFGATYPKYEDQWKARLERIEAEWAQRLAAETDPQASPKPATEPQQTQRAAAAASTMEHAAPPAQGGKKRRQSKSPARSAADSLASASGFAHQLAVRRRRLSLDIDEEMEFGNADSAHGDTTMAVVAAEDHFASRPSRRAAKLMGNDILALCEN